MTQLALTQSQIKKQLKLEGDSNGAILLNGERVGQYLTEKGAGGNAVLVAKMSKKFDACNGVRGGNKEGLMASLAKEMHRANKNAEVAA